MNEASETQDGWDHIPPALAAVARRCGVTAAELDAFRDDPANQDTGLPEFGDDEWARILAPAPDHRPVLITEHPPQAFLPATEALEEPDADDRLRSISRLDALRLRGATLRADRSPRLADPIAAPPPATLPSGAPAGGEVPGEETPGEEVPGDHTVPSEAGHARRLRVDARLGRVLLAVRVLIARRTAQPHRDVLDDHRRDRHGGGDHRTGAAGPLRARAAHRPWSCDVGAPARAPPVRSASDHTERRPVRVGVRCRAPHRRAPHPLRQRPRPGSSSPTSIPGSTPRGTGVVGGAVPLSTRVTMSP